MSDKHLLYSLHGAQVGDHKVHVGEVKQLRSSGWKKFSLWLQDKEIDSLEILSAEIQEAKARANRVLETLPNRS